MASLPSSTTTLPQDAAAITLPIRRTWSQRICKVFSRRKKKQSMDLIGPDNPGKTNEIRLFDMSIGDERVWKISSSLREKNCKIQILNLSQNQIGESGAFALAMALKDNDSLERVLLGGNTNMGAAGMIAIAESLHSNKSVKYLALTQTHLMDEEARAFGKALEVNTTLEDLFLHTNHVCNEGAKCLAKALRVNTTLKALDLAANNINDDGVHAFAEGVSQNESLRHLCLGDNRFSQDGLGALVELAKRNSTLLILDVRDHSSYETVGAEKKGMYLLISYYTSLNYYGRRLVRSNPNRAILPQILERVQWKPDMIYGLIREQPHLYSHSTSE